MGKSVSGKVALGAMILVLVAVAATSYAAIQRQTDAMVSAEERAADLLASAIALSSAADIVKQDLANLVQTARRIKENNPTVLWIAIYDDENRALIEYPEAKDRGRIGEAHTLSRPIQAHGQRFGEIKMIFDREPVKVAREEILRTTFAVAAALLLVALVASLTWAHLFARPIVALAGAAEKVSQGDLTTRVAVAGRDEVGRLGNRFNEMVQNLALSRAELERTLNELSALYSVSKIINTTSDRAEILKLNIETLATGFQFSPVAILLQVHHKWTVAAVKAGGANSAPNLPGVEADLEELGLAAVTESAGAVRVDPTKLSKDWGFGAGSTQKVYAVPLRSGSNLVGILVAGGAGAEDENAAQILSVVGSQIAPPILISIMIEREFAKLTNPFDYIANRVEDSLKRVRQFGIGLSLVAFRIDKEAWKSGATAAEKLFGDLERGLRVKVPDADLVVRYGSGLMIAAVPGWSKLEARKLLMTLDLPHADLFETTIVSYPEDGDSAALLLAAAESDRKG